MASGKVARRAAVADIAAMLDSDEVAALVGELDTLTWTGRKGYGARALVGACLVKSLYGLPTWTRVAALIAEHPGLQDALGGCPSLWGVLPLLDRIAESLRDALPGIGTEVAIDASDLAAFANGQRYVSKNGPERERFSDPDASWGHRSAVSTRSGGGFYGYKIDAAVCALTGLPLAWQVRTARHNESLFVAPLIDAVKARGYEPRTVAMDKGYDNNRVMDETRERGCIPIVSLRKGRAIPLSPIPYGWDEWRRVYRGRAAVEREFGRLKHDYALAPLRVRGLARVQLHADLCILGRLALALQRARAVPLAA
jgi:Transposase DDE domain